MNPKLQVFNSLINFGNTLGNYSTFTKKNDACYDNINYQSQKCTCSEPKCTQYVHHVKINWKLFEIRMKIGR